MININNNEISDIKLGGEQVFAIYAGDQLIWTIKKELDTEAYSCFGSGLWLDQYIWDDNDIWRDLS